MRDSSANRSWRTGLTHFGAALLVLYELGWFSCGGGGLGAGQAPRLPRLLQQSLENVPEFKGIRITGATRTADGTVMLHGLLPSEEARTEVQKKALEALTRLEQAGEVQGPFVRADVTRMLDKTLSVDGRLVQALQALTQRVQTLQGVQVQKAALLPGGVVQVQGSVKQLQQRAFLQDLGLSLLQEEARLGTLQNVIITRLDTQAMPVLTLAHLLQQSLESVPELKGVKITEAVRQSEGMLVLHGRLPAEKLRGEVQKLAAKALQNLVAVGEIQGPYKGVDTSRLIDSTLSQEKQVQFVLEQAIADTGRGAEVTLQAVQLRPDRSVRPLGYLATEKARALLLGQGQTALQAEVARGTFQFALGPLDLSLMQRAPNDLFVYLQEHMLRRPAFRDVHIIYAERTADGTVILLGTVDMAILKEAVAVQALRLLQEAERNKDLPGPFKAVDVSHLRVGNTPLNLVLSIENYLPAEPTDFVRLQAFDPVTGSTELVGIVHDEELHRRFTSLVERCTIVKALDVQDLLVTRPKELRFDPVHFYNQAYKGLLEPDGSKTVEGATEAIRRAESTSRMGLEGWYMRAAGFMHLGQKQRAIGSLRVARTLETVQEEPTISGSYYSILEPLQGDLRLELADYLWRGAEAVLPPATGTQKKD